MLTTKRTLHQTVGMPYLLLLDEDGIVQYRIDKAERGTARKVKFDVLKVNGTGDYCRKAVVEHVDTVTGIRAAKAVAEMLNRRVGNEASVGADNVDAAVARAQVVEEAARRVADAALVEGAVERVHLRLDVARARPREVGALVDRRVEVLLARRAHGLVERVRGHRARLGELE